MPQRLFRVAEGEAVEVPTAAFAVVPGQYDETNWGTDWMLFTAPNAGSACRVASRYDAALNQGRILRPRYLKSLSIGWEAKLTGKQPLKRGRKATEKPQGRY